MNDSGYVMIGLENNFDDSNEVDILEIENYKITNKPLKDLIVYEGEKSYKVNNIVQLAKEKLLKEEITPSKIFPRKNGKYDLEKIKYYLDTILHDDTIKDCS
jgi:hypothetical protein